MGADTPANGFVGKQNSINKARCGLIWIVILLVACLNVDVLCANDGHLGNRVIITLGLHDSRSLDEKLSTMCRGMINDKNYREHEKQYALRKPEDASANSKFGYVNPSNVSMWGKKK